MVLFCDIGFAEVPSVGCSGVVFFVVCTCLPSIGILSVVFSGMPSVGMSSVVMLVCLVEPSDGSATTRGMVERVALDVPPFKFLKKFRMSG